MAQCYTETDTWFIIMTNSDQTINTHNARVKYDIEMYYVERFFRTNASINRRAVIIQSQ